MIFLKRSNFYSKDLKIRVVNAYKNRQYPQTANNISSIFNVSRRSLFYWNNMDNFQPKLLHVKQSKINDDMLLYLKKYILSRCFFNMKHLVKLFIKKYNVSISQSYLYDIIKNKLNISYKRVNPAKIFINKHTRKKQINKFKSYVKSLDINDMFCVDEVHFNNHISPIYGWTTKGNKINIKYKDKERTSISVLAMININNNKPIFKTFNGSVKEKYFTEFINANKHILTNKILLLDNASIHKCFTLKELCKKYNIKLLYNVPYYPQGNPIEQYFSETKRIFRNKFNYICKSNMLKYIINIFSSSSAYFKNYYKHSFCT